MARWILGEEPVSIYSRGSCLIDPEIGKLDDIDTACVTMVTASGRQAVILNSRRAVYGYDQRIEAFGSAGMVIPDNPRATGIKRYSSTSFGAPDRIFTLKMDRYGEGQVINFSGHRTGSPIAEKTHPVLFADLSDAVPTARTLGCKTLMVWIIIATFSPRELVGLFMFRAG